ncbi:MAG TPA: BON domain-containing protein [Fibrobacteria bacterium]|nr:BON domain-containing protein [Fibrobacteria bacterium]
MDRLLIFLAGAGLGAAAGRWMNHEPASAMAWRRAAPAPERPVGAVDVLVRTQSLLREIRALIVHAEVPDPVLEEKIRAKIARMVARPDAVQLKVEQGRVRLAGTARAAEIQALAEGLSALRGVRDVENRLEALTPPFTSWDDAEPASHAARRKPGSYPPSVSLLLAAGGLAFAAIGYRLRKREGAALLAAGAALLGAGGAGLLSPGAFRHAAVSHMSESSSWRPGLKGFRSATVR